MKSFGIASYKRGSFYFDDKGWKILGNLARKLHTSRKKLVIAALRRYLRSQVVK